MMFSQLAFYDRIEAVKACGLDTVEFWKWSNKDIDRIKKSGVKVSVFNMDSTDESLSYDLSRGILNDGRTADFVRALKESCPVYQALNAKALIVLIGENAPYCEENVLKCLKEALPVLERENITLVIEPLNTQDRKGYAMPYASPVFSLLRKLNHPHVKMLYDIYHQNRMGDFNLEEIRSHIGLIGHFHVADVPGRHEPGTGTVDYVSILRDIDRMPYDGYIGLEYRATVDDRDTLGFLEEVRRV